MAKQCLNVCGPARFGDPRPTNSPRPPPSAPPTHEDGTERVGPNADPGRRGKPETRTAIPIQRPRVDTSSQGRLAAPPVRRPLRDRCRAVLLPFAALHHDLAPIEIDVLHPQIQTLFQAHAGTVEQHADDPHRAFQVRQHQGDLLPTEHDGETQRLLGTDDVLDGANRNAEHALVQEEQGGKRLVLRRRTRVLPGREPCQERRDVSRAQVGRMRQAVKADVPADPRHVGDFRPPAVMPRPNRGATTFDLRVDRAGTFRFYSNLTSDPAHSRMQGELVVRPK